MGTLGIIASAVGAAFCFVIAGAVWMEHPGTSSEEDMLALFDITPDVV